MTISYRDVLRAYPPEKAEEHKINNPYSYYVLGPPSLRLSAICINRGMSANHVTVLSVGVVMVTQLVTLLGAWAPLSFVFAGLLINIFFLLDNIDGHIARFCGTTSHVGEFLDAFATWLHLSLFPLSLGFALFLNSSVAAGPFGSSLPAWIWLVLGFLRMYAYLLHVVVGKATDAILRYRTAPFCTHRNKGPVAAKWIVELEPVLLIVAVAAHCVAVVFFLYTLFWVTALAYNLYSSLNRLSIGDTAKSIPKPHDA